MSKKANIMEYFWLVTAIIFLGLGIYASFTKGLKDAGMCYAIVVVSLAMFSMRRSIRKNNQ